MTLNIGVQTIVWGTASDNLKKVLDQIQEIGYTGVELVHAPDALPPAEELAPMLQSRGLTFLGIAAGTLDERMKYCQQGRLRPNYFYIEDWDEEACLQAMEAGYTLALHPHQFKPIDRLGLALPVLEANPKLMFLPDLAHLWLAGDDLINVLETTKDRIAAVHIKDWRPDYGRSASRYARGFSELGQGIIPLDEPWDWIKKELADGWVVVEQDYTEQAPEKSSLDSWRWLHGEPAPPRVSRSGQRRLSPEMSKPLTKLQRRPKVALQVLDQISRDSIRDLPDLYTSILSALCEAYECKFCSLWEVGHGLTGLLLQSVWPREGRFASTVTTMKLQGTPSGQAVQAREIVVTEDLQERARRGDGADPKLLQSLRLEHMVSLPILNTYNMNQPELLIDLFPRDPLHSRKLKELWELSWHIAIAVERAWEQIRGRAWDEINYMAGQCATVHDLIDAALGRIQIHTGCAGASVFLVDAIGARLQLAGTTGLEGDPRPKDVYFARGRGLIGKAWETNAPILARRGCDRETEADHPLEEVSDGSKSAILVPMRDAMGQVMGVIRCRGKTKHRRLLGYFFSVTDQFALEAIQEALSPHLIRMMANEWRSRAVTRLAHELRVPLVVTRGAIELMEEELQKQPDFFSEDFLGDIKSYADLMVSLVGKVRFLKPDLGLDPDRSQPVLLLNDVVAPAVRQVKGLLELRGFSAENIDYSRVMELPRFYLDKARFQQVVFNLLSNAIKYAFKNPAEFHVEMLGRHTEGGCNLIFRDHGAGFDEEIVERAFDEGVRGRSAYRANVSGDGIGLWLVREIVEAHGGSAKITNIYLPTEITVFLPQETQFPQRKERN